MNQREATKRYKAALEATRLCSTHKEQDEEYWGCMSCLAEKFYAQERERIIRLMESHRVVVHFGPFNIRLLSCIECGDVTADQPSHLMRLIKGEK